MDRPRPLYPVPEAIGGRWTVREGAPQVSTIDRTMYVPTGGTPQDRYCRAHEMTHAKITPQVNPIVEARKAGIDPRCLQVCEDARVNNFLKSRRVSTAGSLTDDEADALVRKRHSLRDLAICMVAAADTGDESRLAASMTRYEFSLTDEAERNRFGRDRAIARQIAANTTAQLHRGERLLSKAGFRKATIPAAKLLHQLLSTADELSVSPLRVEGHQLSSYRIAHSDALEPWAWGDLQPTVTAAMTTPRELRAIATQRRFSDYGVTPTAMHRLPVDQRVFGIKRRSNGGTVLLDASGSMHIHADDIVQLLVAAPAATVAMYAGRISDGTLTIIARNGKSASAREIERHLDQTKRNNVVDGPALEWLARQPGPRLWVSDGRVTGRFDGAYDGCTANHYADVARILRVGNITQAETIGAAIRLMSKLRR